MNSTLLYGVAVVPAIVGLTQVAKEIGLPGRFAPGIAVALGVLAALAQAYAGKWAWIPAAVLGISLGLAAVGLYSGTQALTGGVPEQVMPATRPATKQPPAPSSDTPHPS